MLSRRIVRFERILLFLDLRQIRSTEHIIFYITKVCTCTLFADDYMRKQCCQKYFSKFRAFGLRISEISAIFGQISGVFGRFLAKNSIFLPYPIIFIAFLCDNFSKIPEKVQKIFKNLSESYSKVKPNMVGRK